MARFYWFQWYNSGIVGNGQVSSAETTTRSLQLILAKSTKMTPGKVLQFLQEDLSLTYTEDSICIAENRQTYTPSSTFTTCYTRQTPIPSRFLRRQQVGGYPSMVSRLIQPARPSTVDTHHNCPLGSAGTARTAFLDAPKTATNLQVQFRLLDNDSNLQPKLKYDQMVCDVHRSYYC